MKLKTFITILRARNPLDTLRFVRDTQTLVRMQFLYAAMDSGLLAALKTPATQDELAKKLDAKRPELLEALLNVGLALSELSCKNSVYSISGKRSSALADDKGDPLAALVQASLTYYNSFYLDFNKRLHGAPSDSCLAEIGDTVARCSKLYEPFLQSFVGDIVAGKGAMRILDIGCGSGVYLHSAFEANPNVTGIGIDMDAAVVEQARRNLAFTRCALDAGPEN